MEVPDTPWARTMLAHLPPGSDALQVVNGAEQINGDKTVDLELASALTTAACDMFGEERDAPSRESIRFVLLQKGYSPAEAEQTIETLRGPDSLSKWQAVRTVQRHWQDEMGEAVAMAIKNGVFDREVDQ